MTESPREFLVRPPVLSTERLVLRGFDERDFEDYAAMLADPEVSRFLGDGQPMTRVVAWRHLAMVIGHWALRGFGLWAVVERESRRLVGRIGLVEPSGWPGLELAYTLARPFWGRGYAREGARAALDFAHGTLARTEVISLIRPDNAGSIRVATALGGRLAGTVEFFGAPSEVYRYPAPGEKESASREG